MPKNNNHLKSALTYPTKLLNTYQQKINQQQQILTIIKSVLPADIALHALHCVISDKKLLIYTDSSNWSSQLRFFHSAMLNKIIESGWNQVQLLQIKIIPERGEPSLRQTKNIPSEKNIEFIRQQIQSNSDDKLKTSLSKLCNTLDKLSSKSTKNY